MWHFFYPHVDSILKLALVLARMQVVLSNSCSTATTGKMTHAVNFKINIKTVVPFNGKNWQKSHDGQFF